MTSTSEIAWRPPKEYVEKASITRFMKKFGIKTYDELIKRSTDDIEWFWDAALKDIGIEWYRPYDKVLDLTKGIQWASWFPGGKINIVHNCLDKHMKTDVRNKTALIWEAEDSQSKKFTFAELNTQVNRLANAMKDMGVRKGNTVGLYMPMIPEVVIAMLASLKIGAICIPVFSGFGASALATRLNDAGAKILFTADGSTRRGKQIRIKSEADLAAANVKTIERMVVCRRTGEDVSMVENRDVYWDEFVKGKSAECETEQLNSEDYSLLIYTSGTTGKPKGSVHTHAGALAQIAKELAYNFDVRQDEVFFWLTDIGWMMGPWMIIGVYNIGGTVLIFEGAPDHPKPDRLWELIEKHKVATLGISPTAIRLLKRYGDEWVEKHDLKSLRLLGSTGEPWDPDSWMWFFEKVGGRRIPIINISGGTEIVGCFLAPLPICDLKPCTLRGPGLGMAIDTFDDDGKPVRGRMGHLVALKPAPSMTKGFWKDPDRYVETYWSRWPNVWYHGDWALIDDDGFWFLGGRSDDTIKVSGRRTGPGEIESIMMKHPACAEVAAIGVPHDIKGEGIVCFVVLKPGFRPSEELKAELKEQVVKELGKTLKPEEVWFVTDLPKTRTAKIVRRVVRAMYLGKELGDTSSIENPDAITGIKRAQ